MVDLHRYPLLTLSGPAGQALVETARSQLSESGACELAGFVTDTGVETLRRDAMQLAGLAHRSGGMGTAYLEAPDLTRPAEHPRRWVGPYSTGAVAYDLFPAKSPLRRLYEWEPLARLVESVLDRGPVYPYADPFGALNLAVMQEGDQLQWHFDQTDFVVSLAIQPADQGGDFEVAPRIRRSSDECYDDVASVLAGHHDRVVTLALTPGTLLIFEGRNSLHRVSPVRGRSPRLVGLLAYDTEPGRTGSKRLRMDRYGRTEPRLMSPS